MHIGITIFFPVWFTYNQFETFYTKYFNHQFYFAPIKEPDEITPVLEKKQKLTKCDVCNDFAKLQEFSQFEKKAIKGHIMWVHEGKLQCKACDNEYGLDKEKPIEMYDPTMFLCPNCLLSEDLPQIHRR